jgi:4-hydroxybenzoate polyprenyltransferase
MLLFTWMLFWEIGGQNVPADWNDTVEDQRVGAKTIPIRFGFRKAGLVIIAALGLTVISSIFLQVISPLPLGIPYIIASTLAGYFLLLQPGYRLYRLQDGRLAAKLFDKASYYPLAQLVIISLFTIFL